MGIRTRSPPVVSSTVPVASIAAIEATGTVLETRGGDRVRIPNSQLVASIVTLHADAAEPQRP